MTPLDFAVNSNDRGVPFQDCLDLTQCVVVIDRGVRDDAIGGYMYYNFAKIHKTLVAPAMAAGVETRAWSVEEIVGLLG